MDTAASPLSLPLPRPPPPPSASSTSRRPLPAIGTTFPSIDEFKLEAYRVALQRQSTLSICQSSPGQHVHLRCPLGTTEDPCSHRINCKLDKLSKEIKVIELDETHSCGRELGDLSRVTAVDKMQSRIDKLQSGGQNSIQQGVNSRRGSSDEESEYEDGQSVKSSASPGRGKGKGRQSNRGVWDEQYPPNKLVGSEMARLDRSALTFPNSTQTFSTSRELFIYLHATAEKYGFKLSRTTQRKTTTSSTALQCTLGHYRHFHDSNGRCPCELVIQQNAQGSWSVTSATLVHSHVPLDDHRKELAPAVPGLKPHEVNHDEETDDESDGSGGALDACQEEVSYAPRSAKQQSQSWHPSVADIKDRVNSLVEGPPLALPSLSNGLSFASHTDLRIHALAASLQLGFSVYLKNSSKVLVTEPLHSFTLSCHKAHSRYRDDRGGQCDVYITASKSSDGYWRVSEASLNHSHDLEPHEWVLTGSGTRKRQRSTSDDEQSTPGFTSSSNNSISPAYSPKKQFAPSSYPQLASARSTHPSQTINISPTSSQHLKPVASTPNRPHPFTSQLRSFLRALSPSFEPLAQQLLSHGGLDSINAIVALLSLTDERLEQWVSSVGVKKLEEMQLKKALRGVRDRVRDGKRAAEGDTTMGDA